VINHGSPSNGLRFEPSKSWVGVYGQDGYAPPWYPYVVTPAYAQVALSGESTYTYTTATTDPRAVEYPNGSGRMATAWAGNHGTRVALDRHGGPAALAFGRVGESF
jgi:hypothetical protein